jgi:hypothetical protein
MGAPDPRGQAHTLEAVVASLLVVSALLFALQSAAVTPLSTSTSSEQIQAQQADAARGMLVAGMENGSLRRALLHWDPSAESFVGTTGDRSYYTSRSAIGSFGFGRLFQRGFAERSVAYNVVLWYRTASGRESQRLIYRGEPSDNAISATMTTTVYDDDRLTTDGDGDGRLEATGATLEDGSTGSGAFYAPDASPSSDVYNVVEVEVTAWRL